MNWSVTELPWLAAAPPDFTVRVRAAATLQPEDAGAEVRVLAGSRLSASQAAALSRTLAKLRGRDGAVAGLSPLRLAVLSGSTFDLLADHLDAAAARHGVALERVHTDFDQVEPAAFDPESLINQARADFALIAVDHSWLRLDRRAVEPPETVVARALSRVEAVARALSEHGGASPLFCTLPTPPETLFGSFDAALDASPARLIAAFNAGLPALARKMHGAVLDVASLAARIGGDAWFDPVGWYGAKLAFSPACDAAYADLLGRLLGAQRGCARKALVLDLDNTIWGGMVGDDGASALQLGPGDPLGEAFAAVQAYALELHRRGVFLAVCSKNEEAVARAAFESHPGMVLRPEHIAVFQANWIDKASNLEAIASALNIGVDALVLLDDNPAERALVRQALPGVATPELPADPSLYVRTLAAAGYFEATAFSQEDAQRARSYIAPPPPPPAGAGARDLGDYLSGLEMHLAATPFDAAGRARITQLINKTNQFNLLTQRITEAETAALEADPAVVALQLRLRDRYSDLGMIAVLVAKEGEHAGEPSLDIIHWLMSCRVLGRCVETASFAVLMDAAQARGATWITGGFRPTAKNAPVADLLPRLGLSEIAMEKGERRYAARLDALVRPAAPLVIQTSQN